MVERPDPTGAARRLAKRELPRRFYSDVTVAPNGAGHAVLLDGRVTKTPGRKPLVVEKRPVAEALAAEWATQGEVIDPATMPLTRLVNAALDHVAGEAAAVRADIVKYAESDLVSYRAAGPPALVATEEAQWGPLAAWVDETLGVRLRLAAGPVHVDQDPALAAAINALVAPVETLPLAALHLATTLTGSAVIALALLARRIDPDTAWAAAFVDEDWQMSQWGPDEIALAARAARRRDFDAAALVLTAE
jgi:chaperone required for assembly of F1-ATPase